MRMIEPLGRGKALRIALLDSVNKMVPEDEQQNYKIQRLYRDLIYKTYVEGKIQKTVAIEIDKCVRTISNILPIAIRLFTQVFYYANLSATVDFSPIVSEQEWIDDLIQSFEEGYGFEIDDEWLAEAKECFFISQQPEFVEQNLEKEWLHNALVAAGTGAKKALLNGDPAVQGACFRVLGDIWVKIGDVGRARDCYVNSIGLSRKKPVPPELAKCYKNYCLFLLAQGEIAEAEEFFTKADRIYYNLRLSDERSDLFEKARAILGFHKYNRFIANVLKLIEQVEGNKDR